MCSNIFPICSPYVSHTLWLSHIANCGTWIYGWFLQVSTDLLWRTMILIIWGFQQKKGIPPNHPFFHRNFHYKPSILGILQIPHSTTGIGSYGDPTSPGVAQGDPGAHQGRVLRRLQWVALQQSGGPGDGGGDLLWLFLRENMMWDEIMFYI